MSAEEYKVEKATMTGTGVRRGNGIVGVMKEQTNKWERRAPLSPHHCAKLLKNGVSRILVQPCSKRIYRDDMYKDAGCEITNDLSECGLIIGVKQPNVRHQPPYIQLSIQHMCFWGKVKFSHRLRSFSYGNYMWFGCVNSG